MIQCPHCAEIRNFNSSASFRVHKSRYHRGLEYKKPIKAEKINVKDNAVITDDKITPSDNKNIQNRIEKQQEPPENDTETEQAEEEGDGIPRYLWHTRRPRWRDL